MNASMIQHLRPSERAALSLGLTAFGACLLYVAVYQVPDSEHWLIRQAIAAIVAGLSFAAYALLVRDLTDRPKKTISAATAD